ncbi:MAG: hypothetical protein HYX92_20265 [Chloroflexi bacterium]|nr:hypothetical protein [Chloroflexota bacterium]
MSDFVMGLTTMGALVAALFFLRFWRESLDRLFLLFALAFSLEALNRGILGLSEPSEAGILPYTVRFLAYVAIIIAIVDKNLRTPRRR